MEPNNNFKGMFNNEDKFANIIKDKLKEPTPQEALEMLAKMMGANKEWYKNEMLRMMACGVNTMLHDHVVDEIEKGNERPLDFGSLAFLMLTSDMLQLTMEYASEKELKMFHGEEEEDENP
jgi:hypothetical protein